MSHRPDSGLFYLATSLLYLLSCAVFASVNWALSAHPVSQGIYSQAGIYRQVLPVVSRSERERQCRILDVCPPTPTMGGSWSNNQNPITGVQICPTDPTKVLLSLNQRFWRTCHLLSFDCSEAGGRRGAGWGLAAGGAGRGTLATSAILHAFRSSTRAPRARGSSARDLKVSGLWQNSSVPEGPGCPLGLPWGTQAVEVAVISYFLHHFGGPLFL